MNNTLIKILAVFSNSFALEALDESDCATCGISNEELILCIFGDKETALLAYERGKQLKSLYKKPMYYSLIKKGWATYEIDDYCISLKTLSIILEDWKRVNA